MERGVYYRTYTTYTTGLECETFFSAETVEANGAMIVVYEYADSEYTKVTGDLEVGKQYVIAIRGRDSYYSLIGYDNTNSVIKLTPVGTTLTGFEELVNGSHYIDAYSAGEFGVSLRFNINNTKYLSITNGHFGVSGTQYYWEYYWDDVYTDQSRLYTVSSNNVLKVLTVSGNTVTPQASGSDTYLFNYSGSGTNEDPYVITDYVSQALANRSYVIVIYQDGKYYIVSYVNGEVVPVSYGSGFPTTITTEMLWTYNTTSYFKPYGEAGNKYLRTGRNGALTLLDNYTNSSWSYTYSAGSDGSFATRASTAANTTPLYLFKVSMNDSLDAISDTYTTLKGKSQLTPSISVLTSSNYVITATYNGRVYALAMKNLQESIALDITSTFNEAQNGGYIRLFSPSVWEQLGTDYSLIFDSLGFDSAYKNLLSGSRENVFEGSPTTVQLNEMPDNDEPYVWTLYTYGDNDYVLGNYSTSFLDTSFIYFDSSDLSFKITQNETLAKTPGNKVTIYQLGAEVTGTNSVQFQTFKIALEDDNVTIASYPLSQIEAEDIETYDVNQDITGTIDGLVTGEYMIIAKIADRYYALTIDFSGNLAVSDITLLFSGNFMKDPQNNYCISIYTRNLWKQTGTVSYDSATGIASNLTFVNTGTGTSLDLDGTTLSFGNGQLYSINNKYLSFSQNTGFTLSNSESPVELYIYSVGADSIVIGDDELSYSYYSSALNTSALNYSNFSFQKVHIRDLVSYAKGENGELVKTTGWHLTSTTYLEEVNSSVYFASGINYSQNLATFTNEFEQITSTYLTTDEETLEDEVHEVTYYAPKGAVAFVIPEATIDNPVFVNIIATTQQDPNINQNALRYLSVWKVAELVEDELVPLETSSGGASDYALTLLNKFYKPNNAIPLPNHTGTVLSGASYVKNQETVDEEIITTEYNLSVDANWNHLIAHTFCITSPGAYYLGSTFGTVAISYISIGNMVAAEEGEVNEETISDDFSIDFVWGEIPASSAGIEFETNNGVGTIAYVGRTTNSESTTWVHSNIYPQFTNGTAGLYQGSKPDGYNPTDKLTAEVSREFEVVDDIGISTVYIDVSTTTLINDNGNGITYSNMNNAYQRLKRKVEFDILLID